MTRLPFRTPEKLSIEGLQSELSSLIDRWWHCGVSTGPLDGQDWAPAVELRDEPDAYRIQIEVPGIDRSSIELTAQGSSLLVCGEKVQPPVATSDAGPDDQAGRIVHSERRYGTFKRAISVPGPVDVDSISATLADGVLSVTLPKTTGAGPQDVRIDIQ